MVGYSEDISSPLRTEKALQASEDVGDLHLVPTFLQDQAKLAE
jgi:hypothetical protein